jgi:hypothetical protein
MKTIFTLLALLIVTVATMLGPGGVKAVVAQNLLFKQQLLMVRRRRRSWKILIVICQSRAGHRNKPITT